MVKISRKKLNNFIQSVKVELFSELFVCILISGWVGYDHELLSCANMQHYFVVIIWL